MVAEVDRRSSRNRGTWPSRSSSKPGVDQVSGSVAEVVDVPGLGRVGWIACWRHALHKPCPQDVVRGAYRKCLRHRDGGRCWRVQVLRSGRSCREVGQMGSGPVFVPARVHRLVYRGRRVVEQSARQVAPSFGPGAPVVSECRPQVVAVQVHCVGFE